jgi:hypothetical protein
MAGTSNLTAEEGVGFASLGVEVKYHFGIAGGLEAYAKAGAQKTWLLANGPQGDLDYSGRGLTLGGGLQYRLSLPVTQAAIWLDYSHQAFDLIDDTRAPISGSADMLTLGVTIGL